MKTYFHGECVLSNVNSMPDGFKKVKAKAGRYIVADSETTGNHHCIEEQAGVELYEKDGVLYMKNSVPAKLFCVDQARHDTEMVPPGVWEIKRAQEYDYLSEMVRSVVD